MSDRVVTTNYILGGGDGYGVLLTGASNVFTAGPWDAQQLITYLSRFSNSKPFNNMISDTDLTACFTTATYPLKVGAKGYGRSFTTTQ